MKIAITSQNFQTITGHAGKTFRFLIFEVEGNQITDQYPQEIPKEYVFHNFFHNINATPETPHPLDDVDVFITGSAGHGFVHRMGQRGKKVIITSETDPKLAVEKFLRNELEELESHHH
ncbi:MAG: hypothetical protein NZ853_06590 [Leptospiraceae bacterium]|nr:hypothetical protein [Leptospiraceae bacterium]MDW7975899.1 NifB/NifX family molybdenum-iron cluster-binding protein [Leptospiraceae bacterium]